MVSHSKLKLVEYCPCSAFIHPWSHNCIEGIMVMFLSCLKGSFKLFLVVYGIKTLMKRSEQSHNNGSFMIKSLVQSTIYGTLTGTGFVVFNCVMRNLLGKFTYKTLGLVSGMLTGLGIFFEHPSKRGLMTSSFLQMAMGFKMTELIDLKYLKLTKKNTTLIFMLCNAVIMFLMTEYSNNITGNWIMDPVPPEYKAKNCKPSLLKSITKDGMKYFVIGFGLNALRKIIEIVTSKQNSTKVDMSSLLNSRFFGPGVFLGLYIMSYRAMNYILEESLGVKPQLTALISGFVAGASSWNMQPNMSLLSTAMASIILMLCDVVHSNSSVSFKFHREIIYIICCGIVFQARALTQEICPQIVKEVMATATSKRSDEMVNALMDNIFKIESLQK